MTDRAERKSRSRETALSKTVVMTFFAFLWLITPLRLLGLRHRRLQRSVAWQSSSFGLKESRWGGSLQEEVDGDDSDGEQDDTMGDIDVDKMGALQM